MSEHYAKVSWQRSTSEAFSDSKYSREHQWHFDGGMVIKASSSPHVVPLPYSVETNVDPEEAFIASVSSCHMLFFLAFAAKSNFIIDEYIDDAIGLMEKGADNRTSITKITLRPKVVFSGELQPTKVDVEELHRQSHERCFIANSINSKVVVEAIA